MIEKENERIQIISDLIMKLVEIDTKFIATTFIIFLGTFFTLLNESIKFEGATFMILGFIGIFIFIAFIKYAVEMYQNKKQITDLITSMT